MKDTSRIAAAFLGASAGGIESLHRIFENLDAGIRVPLIVVLHIHPDSYSLLPLFEGHSKLPLSEVEHGVRPIAGKIYMAPPDYHILMEPDGTLSLSVFERILHCRPAIDPLFFSAAHVLRSRAAGFVLTGAGSDGAEGIHAIHAAGGLTVVQDPATAAVGSMPESALARTDVDYTASLDEITLLLNRLGR
jgi:two-component system chemotaxis response regulator CheB